MTRRSSFPQNKVEMIPPSHLTITYDANDVMLCHVMFLLGGD